MFILQAIFVIRGLPCFNAGQHYQNCLLLKLGFSFCWLCLALTVTMSSFIFLYELHNILALILPLVSFIILKIVVQYLIY